MSTRCQILFREIHLGKDEETGKERTWNFEAQIYRHSDGYPQGGVLDDLEEFFDWNEDRNDDVSYTAANFIYYMKRDMERNILQYSKEKMRIIKAKMGKPMSKWATVWKRQITIYMVTRNISTG